MFFRFNNDKLLLRSAEKFCIIRENFWEELWNKIIDVCGNDEESFVVYITTIYSTIVYWSFTGLFFLINFVPYCRKFKIQPDKKTDWNKVVKVSLNINDSWTINKFKKQLVTINWVQLKVINNPSSKTSTEISSKFKKV